MARGARTLGLERLKAKIARLPPAAKARMAKANEQSAGDMAGTARLLLKRGDPKGGHLEDTIRVEKGETETGYLTRVGGPGQPYPLHLEAGHKAADGSHVPPQPFWYPAKRKWAKAHKRKMGRVLQAAVDDILK